jgi:DNA-binding transcriptional ArsR family regulator
VVQSKHPPLTIREAVQVFGLLGDANRLRLLRLLARDGEVTVSALREELGLPQPAVSHHLSLLRMGRLVDYRREGKRNFYRICDPVVTDLLRFVGER